MIKKFVIKFSDNGEYGGEHEQKVWSNDDVRVGMYVWDLNEIPEDAIIGRELFDGMDYIDAIQLGFDIAKNGYDMIDVIEEPWDPDDWR